MSAGEQLGRQFMYHYSPGHDSKESVEKHGLMSRDPRNGKSLAESDHQPAGVYMFRDYHSAEANQEGHVWEVDTTGLKLHQDPMFDEGFAKYSKDTIPSHRLKHVREV